MILSTKLMPPQNSAFIIPRPRLFERLAQAMTGRLTVLTAPPGYGKTTLLTHWLAQPAQAEVRLAWLLLDEYDDDPVRFTRYFIAALQQLVPSLGATLEGMLLADLVPLPQTTQLLIATLIDELATSPTPLVLVLDDFHLIANEQIVSSLRYWVEHAPPHLHTILITREAVKLPLVRWRVRQQCTELTVNDLAFTVEEVGQFVRERLRLALTDAQITQLAARTEGWIAGLQLAAFSLQASDDPTLLLEQLTGSDRHVMDYLIEEVLQKQPDDLRDFLLQTSILKRFSPALCQAVTEIEHSYELLAQMESRNLFLIPLDNQRQWYRYHPLFAEALQARLRVSRAHDRSALHCRAYEWYRAAGMYEEAIEQALTAQLYPEVARLLDEQSQAILWQQHLPKLFLRWCLALPSDLLYERATLGIAFGWAQLMTGQHSNMLEVVNKTRSAWLERGQVAENSSQIKNELTVLEAEAIINLGQTTQALALLKQLDDAEEPLNPASQAVTLQLFGYAHRLDGRIDAAKKTLRKTILLSEQQQQTSVWIYAHADLGQTYVLAGELTQAEAIYQTVLDRFASHHYTASSTPPYLYLSLARVQYLGNRLVEAWDNAQRGLPAHQPNGWVGSYGLMVQAEIQQLQGNWAVVDELVGRLTQQAQLSIGVRRQTLIAGFIARLHLLRGQPKSAERWAATYRQAADTLPRYDLHYLDVIFARYQLTTQPDHALASLIRLQTTAAREKWHESLIEINLLLALGHQAQSNGPAALTALNQALAKAKAEKIIAPFLIEGPKIVPLLRQATASPKHRAFVGQLQATFLPTVIPHTQPLIEPLTEREQDVLKLMAAVLSNREIADKLILATGTIAKYSNNIFGKLAVRNRTEATTRAQTLGLI